MTTEASGRPLKVLHLLGEIRPSGAEIMLKTAAPLWAGEGVRCDVLSTGAVPGPYADQLTAAGYGLHHLPYARRPQHFMAVTRLIREGGYDVVHQHLERAGYWYSTAALAAGAGVVRTLHNNFPFDGRLRWIRGWQRRHLSRRGVRFAAIAPGVQANEARRFGLATTLVINWADDRFMQPPTAEARAAARARCGYGADEFVVVSVGNCSHVKNHAVVLEALARCADLSSLRYLHVGVEEADRPEFETARRLGIEQRVQFTGWTPDSLPLLQAADAYIMPSLFEGLSIATIEALGGGLPGLLAEVPGLRDMSDYFDGLIFFPPTAEGAERALREIVNEAASARAARTAEYGRICRDRFSARRGVRDYCALYRQVLPREALR